MSAARSIGRDRRVLVVEDEWLIADMIARTLDEAGYRVVGPVPTAAQAIATLDAQSCDVALVDLNLSGDKSYAVIDRLRASGIPHLLVTGYSTDDLPDGYRACAMIGKPVEPAALLETLAAMLDPVPGGITINRSPSAS